MDCEVSGEPQSGLELVMCDEAGPEIKIHQLSHLSQHKLKD